MQEYLGEKVGIYPENDSCIRQWRTKTLKWVCDTVG